MNETLKDYEEMGKKDRIDEIEMDILVNITKINLNIKNQNRILRENEKLKKENIELKKELHLKKYNINLYD